LFGFSFAAGDNKFFRFKNFSDNTRIAVQAALSSFGSFLYFLLRFFAFERLPCRL
jgi:hypothetical protein